MTVYLMQHGTALSKDVDAERPLADEGRADVVALGEHLAARGLTIPRVLHSPKLRARQSAGILAEAVGGEPEENDDLTADAATAPWPPRLTAAVGDIALVSHLPFIGRLTTRLLTGHDEPAAVAFVPGAMAALALESDQWALQWMLTPDLLRAA